MSVAVAVGTLKGSWILRSDDRERWELEGPHLKGWQVTTFARAPDRGYLLATGSSWYGVAIHRSTDLTRWTQLVEGPRYEESSGRKLTQVWTIAASNDDLLAGVAQAGLFRSTDGGRSWDPVKGLNDHETRPGWEPGAGGLCAHRILIDPNDARRMWVGISAVGVFRSDDGGDSWELRNNGVEVTTPNEDYDIGYCVHCLVADPDDANTIWRQDHKGVYRTADGGDGWERIENGLPAGFGFPMTRDPNGGTLFIVPLESDEFRMPVNGEFRVFRSNDRGESWQVSGSGWESAPSYAGVLRDAMAVDGLEACGIYVGTSAGRLIASVDGGDSWRTLPWTFPRILSVHAFVD